MASVKVIRTTPSGSIWTAPLTGEMDVTCGGMISLVWKVLVKVETSGRSSMSRTPVVTTTVYCVKLSRSE